LIEEGADPTDDGDIDPDDVPDPADAHVAYFGVPCIASVDKDAFLDSVFRLWPAEGDVASRVEFYP
jgi:hypothetical protein